MPASPGVPGQQVHDGRDAGRVVPRLLRPGRHLRHDRQAVQAQRAFRDDAGFHEVCTVCLVKKKPDYFGVETAK